MTPKLPILFRRDSAGGIVAIFPTLIADPAGNVTSYAHVGQHGSASLAWVKAGTRPAHPAEYSALMRELSGIYEVGADRVRLVIRQRLATSCNYI